MSENERAGIGAALAAAQAEFPPITRSRTVEVKTRTGGTYKFSYAPLDKILEAVRGPLSANGLALTQPLTQTADGRPALATKLLHASGQHIESLFPLPVTEGQSPQEFGSLLTYFRRYAIVALLGIASEEDDDGTHASGGTSKPAAAAKPKAKTEPKAEAKAEPKPATPPGMLITDPQRERLFAIFGQHHMPANVLRDLMVEVVGEQVKDPDGHPSTRLIPRDKYDELIRRIEALEDIPF